MAQEKAPTQPLGTGEASPSATVLDGLDLNEPLAAPSRTRRKAPPPPLFDHQPRDVSPPRRQGGAASIMAEAPDEAAPEEPPSLDEPLPAPSMRRRTAPPPAFSEPVADVVPSAGGQQNGKMQQMLHLHEMLHNPLTVDLREPSLENSSSREEIVTRLADLRHRVAMIAALSTVLGEEVTMLEGLLASLDGATETPLPK